MSGNINFSRFKDNIRIYNYGTFYQIEFTGICPIVGTHAYILLKDKMQFTSVPSLRMVATIYFKRVAELIINLHLLGLLNSQNLYYKQPGRKNVFSDVKNNLYTYPEITTEMLRELRKVEINKGL